jgi:hypothetical protein
MVNLLRDIFALLASLIRWGTRTVIGVLGFIKDLFLALVQFVAGVLRYAIWAMLAILEFLRDVIVGMAHGSARFQTHFGTLKERMRGLKAQAATFSRRTWSNKEVAVLVVVLILAMPLLSVLVAAAVPVLAIVGVAVIVGAWLGMVKVESPATIAEPTASPSVPPTPGQGPAPPAAPSPEPRPYGPVVGVDPPPAYCRPETEPGSNTLSGLVRVIGIVLLVISGGGFLLLAQSVGQHNRREFRRALAPRDQFLQTPLDSAGRSLGIVPAPIESHEQLDEQIGELVQALSVTTSNQPVRHTICVHGSRLDTREKAEEEILLHIGSALARAAEAKYDLEMGDWMPSANWMRRNRDVSFSRFGSVGTRETGYTWTGEVCVLPQVVPQVIREYGDWESWPRAQRLAKMYAGAVFVMGALAIFLRLGTGRYV